MEYSNSFSDNLLQFTDVIHLPTKPLANSWAAVPPTSLQLHLVYALSQALSPAGKTFEGPVRQAPLVILHFTKIFGGLGKGCMHSRAGFNISLWSQLRWHISNTSKCPAEHSEPRQRGLAPRFGILHGFKEQLPSSAKGSPTQG